MTTKITPEWLEAQLVAIKQSNPNGITVEQSNDEAVKVFTAAVELEEQERRTAAAQARMAASLADLQGFRAGRSSVSPVDIGALTGRRLGFRDKSRASIDADLAPTRAAINIGFGVLAAGVPVVMSGGAVNPATMSALVAPLSGVIMDFVNN